MLLFPISVDLLLLILLQFGISQGQQSYVNNKQLSCEANFTTTLGYVCNGATTSCRSYLTFRSDPTHNNPPTISALLGADAAEIAQINNVTEDHTFPVHSLVVVPVNCSCSGGKYYQHTASYVLKMESENYFTVANNTYQGLTTCQAMIDQNPYYLRNLLVGMRLNVPLRCACPTANQTAAGFKYLLAYLVTWGNDVSTIADTFGVEDFNNILNANELKSDDLIFPFTPLLIPLKSEPINIMAYTPPSAPPPPRSALLPLDPSGGKSSKSSRKWIFVGVGIAAAFLLLFSLTGFLVWFFRRHRQNQNAHVQTQKLEESAKGYKTDEPENKSSWLPSVQSQYLRDAIGSLSVYRFEELLEATNSFAEANRIEGSVYKGSFKGDDAAVKLMKGDVSREINVLKHINHSSIIRLSGFCVHEGITYLVSEYAENGSLNDWLHNHQEKKQLSLMQDSSMLGWKQRIQVAYDVADALNYLHNYANPPYIHKNLSSSNILLDFNLRAKVVNFGLSRAINENPALQNDHQEEGNFLMTRHVVGTHGYMAPEYIENGILTPKLDLFSLGVVLLELLSGKEAAPTRNGKDGEDDEMLLSAQITQILSGEHVREDLNAFMDPCLGREYPLDMAFSVAQLAKNCVSDNPNHRPTMAEVLMTLSKILSLSLDWDPTDELERSRSLDQGR